MPRKTITKTCEHCGNVFEAPAHNVAKGFGRFCSRSCAGFSKHGHASKRQEPRTLTCPQCGDVFTTRDKRQVYCSKKCAGAANRGPNHYRWNNHAPRINFYGYRFIYAPSHRSAGRDGYAREHIIIAEKMIGRDLRQDECVHHINRVKDDNRPCNLQVMTFAAHSALHNADAPDWYSDEELVAALHEMARRLGRNPRKRDVDIFDDLPGRKAYTRHFGTWNNALRAAGLPVNMVRP